MKTLDAAFIIDTSRNCFLNALVHILQISLASMSIETNVADLTTLHRIAQIHKSLFF